MAQTTAGKHERMQASMPARANVENLQRVLFARAGMLAFCADVFSGPRARTSDASGASPFLQ